MEGETGYEKSDDLPNTTPPRKSILKLEKNHDGRERTTSSSIDNQERL